MADVQVTQALWLAWGDDHPAVVAFSNGVRGDVRMLLEGHVHDAPLGWLHGVQKDWLTIALGSLGRAQCDIPEHTTTPLAIALHVNDHAYPLGEPAAGHQSAN